MLRLLRLFPRHLAQRVSATLVAITMGLALLAGCAEDEPEPKFEAEPTTAPSTPADANTQKETVKEFLTRWAKVESDMQNTGKTEEYLALSPGCQPCEAFASSLEDMYAKGGYIRTEALSIDKVKRVKGSKQQYHVWATQPPTVSRNSATDPEESNKGGSRSYLFSIGRSDEGFAVRDMARTPR